MDFDYTIGGTASSSYLSEEDALSYFATRLHSTLWEDFEDKQSALITATRLLDQWVKWQGYKNDENQALDWPRQDVVDENDFWIPSDIIPVKVKNACCELAYSMLAEDRTAENDMKGFKEIKVGSLKLVADKSDAASAIPDTVWMALGHLGKKPYSCQVPVYRR